MQDPNQYLTTIAQMILQGAQASAAQEEQRAQRESEMAFRREQLSSQRDFQGQQLALEKQRTDSQIAENAARTEGVSEENKQRKIRFATEAVDDQIFQMETGENRGQFEARNAIEDRDLGRRLKIAQVTSAEDAANPESQKNKIAIKQIETSIDADKARQDLANFQLSEAKSMSEINRQIADGELRANQIKQSAAALELAKNRTEYYFNSNGLLAPSQEVPLRAEVAAKIRLQYSAAMLDAAQKAAEGVGASGEQTVDMAKFRGYADKVDEITQEVVKLERLKQVNPVKAREVQTELRSFVKNAMDTIGDPDKVGPLALQAMKLALQSVEKKPTTKNTPNKPPPPPETESGRRLRVKKEAAVAESENRKRDVSSIVGNLSDDELAQIEAIYPNKSLDQIAATMEPLFVEAERDLSEQYDIPPRKLIFDRAVQIAKGKKPMRLGRSEKVKP